MQGEQRRMRSPGRWAVLAWAAGESVTYLTHVPTGARNEMIYRGDGLALLALATALALLGGALARRHPFPALAALLAAAVTGSIPLGVTEIPMAQFLAAGVLLYHIAATRPHGRAVAALCAALAILAGYVTTRWLLRVPAGFVTELSVALAAVVAWLVGRSARRADEFARRSAAQATEQAVVAERLRIARELHDIAAHNIGVIALQAGAARRVIDTRPDRARESLAEIEALGRDTLSSLRRTLGTLRDGEAAPPYPEPGLADLDRLVATAAEAGVRAEVRLLGTRRPLPPEIDVSAYRIVQEAVTNVVRHARTDACEVVIAFGDDELTIEVLDDGRGHGDDPRGGYGLLGMRERVDGLAGKLTAGPRPEGGFRVAARLPLPAAVR